MYLVKLGTQRLEARRAQDGLNAVRKYLSPLRGRVLMWNTISTDGEKAFWFTRNTFNKAGNTTQITQEVIFLASYVRVRS